MDYNAFLDCQFVMTDNKRIDRVRDLYTTFNPEVDLEALKEGGYLKALAKMMEPVLMDLDDHSPEVVAYGARQRRIRSAEYWRYDMLPGKQRAGDAGKARGDSCSGLDLAGRA